MTYKPESLNPPSGTNGSNQASLIISLTDASFNPEFPVLLQSDVQRSHFFPLSPCSTIFQSQLDATLSYESIEIDSVSDSQSPSYNPLESRKEATTGATAISPKGSDKHSFNMNTVFSSFQSASTSTTRSPERPVQEHVRPGLTWAGRVPTWEEVKALYPKVNFDPKDKSSREILPPPTHLIMSSNYAKPRIRDVWAEYDLKLYNSSQVTAPAPILDTPPITCLQTTKHGNLIMEKATKDAEDENMDEDEEIDELESD